MNRKKRKICFVQIEMHLFNYACDFIKIYKFSANAWVPIKGMFIKRTKQKSKVTYFSVFFLIRIRKRPTQNLFHSFENPISCLDFLSTFCDRNIRFPNKIVNSYMWIGFLWMPEIVWFISVYRAFFHFQSALVMTNPHYDTLLSDERLCWLLIKRAGSFSDKSHFIHKIIFFQHLKWFLWFFLCRSKFYLLICSSYCLKSEFKMSGTKNFLFWILVEKNGMQNEQSLWKKKTMKIKGIKLKIYSECGIQRSASSIWKFIIWLLFFLNCSIVHGSAAVSVCQRMGMCEWEFI